MKLLSRFQTMLLTALLAVPGAGVLAHTALTASLPGNEAVVASPEALQLNFSDDVRLLRVTLVHGADHEVDFGFTPSTAAASEFSFELPALMDGAHSVNWTVIGPDGHTVSGDFGFTVSPDGEAAVVEASSSDHHH